MIFLLSGEHEVWPVAILGLRAARVSNALCCKYSLKMVFQRLSCARLAAVLNAQRK